MAVKMPPARKISVHDALPARHVRQKKLAAMVKKRAEARLKSSENIPKHVDLDKMEVDIVKKMEREEPHDVEMKQMEIAMERKVKQSMKDS